MSAPTSLLIVGNYLKYLEIKKLLVPAIERAAYNVYWSDFEYIDLYIAKTQPQVIIYVTDAPERAIFSALQLKCQVEGIALLVLSQDIPLPQAARHIAAGAQDVLFWQELNATLLIRTLQYALARQQCIRKLQTNSWFDELTGLYNRRTFLALARHHLQVSARSKKPIVVCFIDVDNMKQINDTFGHPAGDATLTAAAAVLRQTFRTTDVIARLGGDEFLVLAIDADSTFADSLTKRLRATTARAALQYPFSLSIGIAYHHSGNPTTIEELIAIADRNMYRQKQAGTLTHSADQPQHHMQSLY